MGREQIPDTSNSTSVKRAKKACTECRQQKARCDASINVPCTRCRKVKAECVISAPFKRENKRQKLNELEHEAQELRERLESMNGGDGRISTRSASTGVASSDTAAPLGTTLNTALGHDGKTKTHDDAPMTRTTTDDAPSQTLSRELNGQKLTAGEIGELFELYFTHFSPFLPILDSLRSPNEYYDCSILLFWSIIGVGSRAYARLPSLIHDVRIKICDMAFDALKMSPTLETIQALLLIVTWPFPKNSGIWNPTFALLGAVLHSAMAIGLHIPTSSQEFLKYQSKLTPEELRQRMVTWAYCVIVYQRTCICKGNPSLALSDVCHFPQAREMLYHRLDATSCFQLRLHDTVTRALRAFSESGLPDITPDQEHSFAAVITMYLTQLEELHSQASLIVDQLDHASASLTLQIFHFYRTSLVNDVTAVNNLFTTACQVLERFDKMSHSSTAGLKSLPIHHVFALLNASETLLRLFQTPAFAIYIDETRAKAMVYLAVSLAKKMTVHPEDLPARAIKALSDTAESTRAFKSPDGDGMPVPLRIRSRLAMSLILDGLMWWREEFGGTMGVFPTPLKRTIEDRAERNGADGLTPNFAGTPVAAEGAALQVPFDATFDSLFSDQPWIGYEDLLSPSFLTGDLNAIGAENYLG